MATLCEMESTNLKETLMFICKQKINLIHEFFFADITI